MSSEPTEPLLPEAPGRGLRVLTLTNLYPTPEAPTYGCFVASQVESLRRQGITTDVCFIDGRASRWSYLRAPWDVRSCLERGRYHLVHAHYSFSAVYALVPHRLPVVAAFLGDDVIVGHERFTALKRCVRDYVASRADAVIVKTREMKEILGIDGVHVVPNGVDLARFRPIDRTESRLRLAYEAGRRYVLFPYDPGRAVKGFDLAEAAMRIVVGALPSARLTIVSRASPETMPYHYNAADVLLLTSLREGSPNTVKEALACDLPIVATACGDVEERLRGVKGCRVVERSPSSIAQAILAVLASPDPRSDGRAHLASVESSETARRIIGIYKSLLA